MNHEELKLGFISREAAARACKRWHYSKTMPGFNGVDVGVWEKKRFIGVVSFGTGTSPNIARPFKIEQNEIAELVRVALDKHESTVSRIVAIAIKILRKHCPGLRLLVSFADSAQGHHGGIYQAGGWVYVGDSFNVMYRIHGVLIHSKTIREKYRGCTPLMEYLRKYGREAQIRLRT